MESCHWCEGRAEGVATTVDPPIQPVYACLDCVEYAGARFIAFAELDAPINEGLIYWCPRCAETRGVKSMTDDWLFLGCGHRVRHEEED